MQDIYHLNLATTSALAFLWVCFRSLITELMICFISSNSAAIAILQGTDYLRLSAKRAVSLAGITKYGGNIVGGLLIGAGMALSGACPGTVLVQAIQGIPSGIYASIGAVLGGFVYSTLSRVLPLSKDAPSASIPQALGISPLSAFLGWEIMCATVLGLSTLVPKTSRWPMDPFVGGIIIGGAQITSLMLRKSTIGVSSVFGDISENTIKFFSSSSSTLSKDGKKKKTQYETTATQFAIALMAGSYLLTTLRPEFGSSSSFNVSPQKAIFGGLALGLGSRLAKGCTSGHGLSGSSQLAVSSLITTGAMFGGGIAVATLL